MPEESERGVPFFFLIAGEASGDLLGARLMQALKRKANGKVRFAGIGGPRMQAEGIELLFPQTELAHMGLFELARHLPHLLARIKETIEAVKAQKPAALITIDSPDFCFRVAKKLKGQGFPLIHYVAPSVWAWRPGRAKKVAQFLDHLLALLPFEPPYFTAHHLPCTFVGHPLVESDADQGDEVRFRARFGLGADVPLLALLPGSRVSEVTRLLPVFRATCELLAQHHPDLHLVVPTVPGVETLVCTGMKDWPLPVHFVASDADKYDAFAAARAALACSGTVSVELAMAGLPTIIAYKTGALTAMLYRRFIKTKYATLLNIMQGRMVMPEFLQENCVPHALANAVELLLTNEKARAQQKSELETIGAWLGRGQFVPSEKAAETVWAVAFPERKNLRVLQVIPALGTGGAEQGCVDVAAALVSRGDVAFVASTGGRQVGPLREVGGEPILHDVKTKNPIRIIRNAFWLADFIRREQIDIVHARSRAPAWSVLMACRMTGCAYVATFHAPYTISNRVKKFYNSVMARADHVIAISAYVERYIFENYGLPREKVTLINRGSDLEDLDPGAIAEERKAAFCAMAGIDRAEKCIVMPARLSFIKGQDVLIEAMGILKGRGVPFPKVLIIGDDQGREAYSQKLKDLIKTYELGAVVKLVGVWSDIAAAYCAACLTIVPSTKPEGFGRVPIESMAMGVPVVASSLGAPADTVVDGKTGWLVEANDPEALATAIQKALAMTTEERLEMAKAGRARVEALFNTKRMVAQTLAVYDEVVGRRA